MTIGDVDLSPDAEALLAQLREVAPADDVALVAASAVREATLRRHRVVVRGHVVTVLVNGGADADLLRNLGIDPGLSAVQLADLVKREVDAAPVPDSLTGAPPCPACGDTEHRRHETRRLPAPGGGRGSTMARIGVCGACGTDIGPG